LLLALLICQPGMAASPAPPAAVKKAPLVSFEGDAAVLASVGAAKTRITLSNKHVTQGKQSLEAVFGLKDYPNVSFQAGKAFSVTDWRPYGALIFDAYNADAEPLQLNMRMDDNANHNWNTSIELPPKKQVRVAMVLRLPNTGMRGYPMAAACKADVSGYFWQTTFDLGNISSFQFFCGDSERERSLFIDNIHLTEITPLRNIVDKYGQFTLADWPGKIHSDKEMIARHRAEAKALLSAPAPPERDPWGGWTGGPQLAASGWFRSEKLDGKWWLVTPGGRLFWSVGLDCVGPEISGPVRGHEELFAWQPKESDPLYAFGWKGGWVNFWGMNLYRTYGPDWENHWLDLTRQRMRAWGFNTIGNWSAEKACRELRVPFTVPISYKGVEPFNGEDGSRSDFFSESWAKTVEEAVIATTTKWKDDAYCLGYFVDNELPWPKPAAFTTSALGLTGERAVKRALTAWLRKKYGEIGKLNTAWGITASSWDDFEAKEVKLPEKHSAALADDAGNMLTEFANRYYSTVALLMKKHAPNQLYLGSRFSAVPPDEVALASAKYCQVVSYNIYGRTDTLLSRGKQIALFDRPVMIGEFHFGALDRGMFHGGMVGVSSQRQRGVEYAGYVRTAAQQPWCVGAHWFTYGDEMLTGRGDGENFNIGFVSCTDIPYPELVRRASAVNADIYQIRSGQAK
jgi:hypothetical protein